MISTYRGGGGRESELGGSPRLLPYIGELSRR